MHEDSARHRVAVLALPGVVAFDLSIATQTLGHEAGNRYRVQVCTPTPGVVTSNDFPIMIKTGLGALRRADTVLVPGFRRGPVAPAALSALRAAHRRGARIASICTGAFALAEAGLLDGLRATTHWKHAAELARRHPAVRVEPQVLYVDNGQVLTSAGLAAGLDLCLHLIASDHGEQVAADRARDMVTPLHRAGGQAQFIAAQPGLPDGALAAVTTWALKHLHEPIGVPELARHARLAPRTFSRHFSAQVGSSPHVWLSQLRLRRACTLLEDPDVGIDEVARRSGLGSAANLRLHFRRAYDTTPTAYRVTFTGRSGSVGGPG